MQYDQILLGFNLTVLFENNWAKSLQPLPPAHFGHSKPRRWKAAWQHSEATN